jgi:hypothetical protein
VTKELSSEARKRAPLACSMASPVYPKIKSHTLKDPCSTYQIGLEGHVPNDVVSSLQCSKSPLEEEYG